MNILNNRGYTSQIKIWIHVHTPLIHEKGVYAPSHYLTLENASSHQQWSCTRVTYLATLLSRPTIPISCYFSSKKTTRKVEKKAGEFSELLEWKTWSHMVRKWNYHRMSRRRWKMAPRSHWISSRMVGAWSSNMMMMAPSRRYHIYYQTYAKIHVVRYV